MIANLWEWYTQLEYGPMTLVSILAIIYVLFSIVPAIIEFFNFEEHGIMAPMVSILLMVPFLGTLVGCMSLTQRSGPVLSTILYWIIVVCCYTLVGMMIWWGVSNF